MHFMAFALKRAHLRALALVRPWLKPSPITPARYDLLYVIHERRCRAATQASLARTLGLSSPTVSRTLKRLEQLGIVERTPHERDRRVRIVRFTVAGLREFRHILYDVVCPGHLHMAYEGALGSDPDWTFLFLDDVFMAVRDIAKFFGDRACLWYPTGHPDD